MYNQETFYSEVRDYQLKTTVNGLKDRALELVNEKKAKLVSLTHSVTENNNYYHVLVTVVYEL